MGVQRRFADRALREVVTPSGLGPLTEIEKEFDTYVAVITGRVSPPMQDGFITLQELADAYYARACDVERLILRGERRGEILSRGPVDPDRNYYKFRTGELQSYLNMFKRAAELGSRRITHEQMWSR